MGKRFHSLSKPRARLEYARHAPQKRTWIMEQADFKKNWKEIVSGFLKLGATAYGGPAIYGILQAELQEKRRWVSKERFVEGLFPGQPNSWSYSDTVVHVPQV